jgi:hypothetical protein
VGWAAGERLQQQVVGSLDRLELFRRILVVRVLVRVVLESLQCSSDQPLPDTPKNTAQRYTPLAPSHERTEQQQRPRKARANHPPVRLLDLLDASQLALLVGVPLLLGVGGLALPHLVLLLQPCQLDLPRLTVVPLRRYRFPPTKTISLRG